MTSHKSHEMPTAAEALPGRATSLHTDEVHYVSGRPLKGPHPEGFETAILGMGCFWGVERIFWQLPGVWVTSVGYTGGITPNPTYEETCTGRTGHAEVVSIEFDPEVISRETILDVFFTVHDPTQLNRQGHDIGTQYRSAMFYETPGQRELFESAVARANEMWGGRVVTEIAELEKFYPVEDYHQDYFANNPTQGYCVAVVAPKVGKVRQSFSHLIK